MLTLLADRLNVLQLALQANRDACMAAGSRQSTSLHVFSGSLLAQCSDIETNRSFKQTAGDLSRYMQG